MNHRQKELLRILLLHREGPLQIKELSSQLHCVEKTIRNDLDKLEEYLASFPNTRLIRKPGFGIFIDIMDETRGQILKNLLSSDQDTISTEDRMIEMAFKLLTSKKAVTLQDFADCYYVSKAAIKKDLDLIASWLQRYELEVLSKPRMGNVIQGSELKKRNALAHLSELCPSARVEKNYVLDLFLPYEISTVRKALEDLKDKFSLYFTDNAIESLLVHTLIMVKRTRQRSPVFVKDSEREMTYERKEYDYSSWFFGSLEEALRLTFPEVERVYFTWHLISSKRTDEEFEQVLEYDKVVADMVNMFTNNMETMTQLGFGSDSILKNGLAVHLHSVINRMKYGFPITNPLLANIKKMYPYIFNMVILTLDGINKSFQLEISEHEAAYIVLHFQASLERMECRKEEKKKALIVCHMGIGMSHLLEAKIQQHDQKIDIVACIGKAELSDYIEKYPIDFIISTVQLDKLDIDYIVISPLLNGEDKKKVNQFVEKIKLNHKGHQDTNAVSRLLTKEFLFLNVVKEHRYEVVELLATSLYEKGYVEKEFIHSTVNRERKSATAIGGGIAIPHGNPSMVHKSAIAVAVMKEPIRWGNEQVSLVFLLAIANKDHREIKGIIGKISSLSESPMRVHALAEARNDCDFFSVFEENE